MFTIDQMIDYKEYELYNDTGNAIDSFFCAQIYTYKDKSKSSNPFTFDFITSNFSYWNKFVKDCDEVYFNTFGNQDIFAVFNPNKDYPFYRFYFLDQILIQKFSINTLINTCNAKDFLQTLLPQLISQKDILTKNVKDWFIKMDEQLNPSTKMAKGRNKNTIIDKTIILSRQPKGCVACGEKATGYISSILKGQQTIYFIANTCEEHQECAKKYPNFLNYILQLLQVGELMPPFEMKENISKNVIDLLFKEIAQELDAPEVMEKRLYRSEIEQTTGTFKRKTGFTIKIRLKTLMNYGYIIDDPNGKQFKRIDSANHHNDKLFVGPDHIHHDPHEKTSKQHIESSYTTGFPLFDIPIIKQLVQDAEESFN